MALSDFKISKAKPKDKPYKLYDSLGLFLLISQNGSKLWRQKYKCMGKEGLLAHGAYPTVSLAEARRKREDVRKQLSDGVNPGIQRKLDRITAETQARTTFKLISEEYIEACEEHDLSPATMKKKRWFLLDLASPLHNRPINEITPAELLYLQVIGDEPVQSIAIAKKKRRKNMYLTAIMLAARFPEIAEYLPQSRKFYATEHRRVGYIEALSLALTVIDDE